MILTIKRILFPHLILPKRHVEESNPGGHVASVHALLVCALHHEVECLGEPEQEDDVDDGESEHVARDHREDHCHEWPRQLDSSAMQV